jgi:hypothetical protein
MGKGPENEMNLAGSALQERWFFVAPCSGASQNLKPPVIVSLGHMHSYKSDFDQTSVGCPFIKRVWKDHENVYKCVAQVPKDGVSDSKAIKNSPNCFFKNQV